MNEYISQQRSQQACPNQFCANYGKNGNEFISIHDRNKNRLRCKSCGKTWSTHRREFHYGLRTELVKIHRAGDMLRAKIPIRTTAQLIKVSPTTIMRWKKKLFSNQ